MLDVAVVGNIGIDTNVYFHGNEPDFSRESNFTENIDYIGQAGGYTSRIYAKLGMKTAFIGAVGNDPFGNHIQNILAADHIDTSGIFIDSTGTSRSINFMYKDGCRKNFYDGKNHMNLEPDTSLITRIFSKTKLAHFHIPNWARKLLPIAKRHSVKICTDLQDITEIEDNYRKDFIEHSDIVFFSSANLNNPTKFMHDFNTRYTDKIFICGMGKDGVLLGMNNQIRSFPVPKSSMPVIDTNGAGDSLASGFIAAFMFWEMPIERAILFGQIVARHTCSIKASTDNFLTKEDLIARMSKQS